MEQINNIDQMEEAAYKLRAISHSTRLCIISLLSEKEELNVSQISEELNCEQSLLSHHLTDMRAKGILNCRRDGKNCYYSLKNKEIVQILDCIRSCQCTN
ncbi:MAG TPA: metalloregulator ArsR/SmtB family transcription factor [Paludibacteraceae bacterium]|jgi:ArsR family transcriptional regulator|nr:winged helix-turn-helix transcriptional regulator [Paludibacteraceae bacterium]MBP9017380.1 winged helix-turn-helix transcriptional regulator [Paludibacteraceae bacterium]MDS1032649.1 metalloregulator ArsR/SmtB family transcription factor [Porphyromonadaceae sp. NP-X]HOH55478.1 metalloregulator ArsR/SmtB family transcription factor [Paludibacteraceae bacterium]